MSARYGTQAEAEQLLRAVVDVARRTWPDRLRAAYALGSLAHGGFCPQVSDIDLGLILDEPLLASDSDAVTELVCATKASKGPFADRLSVYWGSLATLAGASPSGRFPPLDRLDLKLYGRLIAGRDVRSDFASPTHRELVFGSAEFALRRLATEEVIQKLNDPHALIQADVKTLTKLILYPVRLVFTARTGEVGRNDAAVEHFVSVAHGPTATLARLALAWRTAPPSSGDGHAIDAIARGLIPLYQTLVLDYEPRLREYGRPDLAEAFQRWRERLQAL